MNLQAFLNWLQTLSLSEGLALVEVIVPLLGIILAVVSIRQASGLSKKANQPYVTLTAEPLAANVEILELVLTNHGPTMARNVKVLLKDNHQFLEPHDGGDDVVGVEIGSFENRSPIDLAPGQRWGTIWGSYKPLVRVNAHIPIEGYVRCDNQPRGNRVLRFPFKIDLQDYQRRTYLQVNTIHSIGKDVRDILEYMGGPRNRETRTIKPSAKTVNEMAELLGGDFLNLRVPEEDIRGAREDGGPAHTAD